MEIPSAMNSGLQGLQNARATADQAAEDIVASTTLSNETQKNPANNGEVNTELSNPSRNNELPDLNQAIVNLKVAEYQAKASTEVIKSADDSLGTLLDVTA
ncbi:hypothetical protein [Colwellia psychrerythraea]|uniref:Flagellar basal-body/hook protein C-terminal domain-containing protein n=1 Tax=Colwellia psychrerythraea (strain 34H / ATCC BAA-681) TaxID=167879 RepID=Q48AD0_COLP3|nr:hypothetical protein [Colwellia psychrerythraea]AAZ26950.1 hypothetical protein CPS_0216 [Colwellia psychrerythraea 34H]